MKSNTQGTASGIINLAIVLITAFAVIEIEAKFNFSYSYSDWAIAIAMGIGIYALLSFSYFLIAKRFKLPQQRILDPLNILFVFIPWW